jgi:hypothetical protein
VPVTLLSFNPVEAFEVVLFMFYIDVLKFGLFKLVFLEVEVRRERGNSAENTGNMVFLQTFPLESLQITFFFLKEMLHMWAKLQEVDFSVNLQEGKNIEKNLRLT